MNLSGLSLNKVDENTIFKSFECNDSDLNEFLLIKSKHFFNENLATTFIIEDENLIHAYYSIFNDSLRVEEMNFASKSKFERFLKSLVPHRKRHLENFPAIKIGRLAVNSAIQKSGLGKIIVNSIIDYAINSNNSCACKLITVDAYKQ